MLARVQQLPQHELAARARAAIAYSGLDQKEFYEPLNVERTTFARKLGRKGGDKRSSLTEREIEFIADRAGVPHAWFSADFSRLEEIPVPARSLAEIAAEAALLRPGTNPQPQPEADDRRRSGQAG